MLELLTENNFLYFFSTNAQVFGALLGLIGLSHARLSDVSSKNVDTILDACVKSFTKKVKDLEEKQGKEIKVELEGIPDLRAFILKMKKEFTKHEYTKLIEQLDNFEEEVSSSNKRSQSFRRICWITTLTITLSLFGILIPLKGLERTLLIFCGINLLSSLLAIYMCLTFFMAMSKTSQVKIYDND